MAVYFDHRAQAPNPGQNTDIQWHKNFAVLAVASHSETTGGSVNLYLEEGDHEAEAQIRKSRPASVLAWHPLRRALAIGWETGEVTVWNDTEHELYEAPPIHKGEITIVHWTSNGSKLLTGDALGTLVLWKTDSRGRIQQAPLYQDSLNEQLMCCILKPPPPVDPAHDIANLARAAVSGDESALDLLSYNSRKNVRGNSRQLQGVMGPQEATTFYVGGKHGSVFYINENNKLVQQFMAEGPVRKLLYYEDKDILITITTNMMLTQHSVGEEGDTREILKVKLSGKMDNPETIWAGKGVLATCTGENVLRMWDLEKEENYILNMESLSAYDRTELITCISYCANKGVLAGGTGAGHIAMWKYSPAPGAAAASQEPEDRWKLQPPCTIDGAISELAWGSSKNLLALNTVDSVFILSEQVMSAHYSNQTAVVQTGPMALSVDVFSTITHHDLKTDIQVKGVHTTRESIAIWDGKKIVVYEISGDMSLIRAAGTVSTESPMCCIYEQNLYTLEPGKIQVRTFQGTVKQLLLFTEQEGDPLCMEVCGHYLVAASTNGFLKLYDLSRREAKLQTSPKNLAEAIPTLGTIVSVKCNCNGSRVSAIVRLPDGKVDAKIYIWDVELDGIQFFNFETGRGEQDEYIPQTSDTDLDATDADRGKSQAAKDIAGRHPVGHFWDTEEPKLLVCETHLLPQDQQREVQEKKMVSLTKATMDNTVEVMVVSLFATQENGIMIQDSSALSTAHNGLLGVQVPYFYFTKKADQAQESEAQLTDVSQVPNFAERPQTTATPQFRSLVSRRVMRDFVGLENADKGARDAMMDFSYYLTIGNMDEAFKAIKLIKSESVWENMAQMCVKNRRLDVAMVCLGNMGHARGAKALREAGKEAELDARVATLAMQLGLTEDAERLLKNCKRYDLLNELYQCSNQWGKALEAAEMYDRIHLRTTYYSYAKHLESKGDISGAIPVYEKSDTHRFEVPRMLLDEPAALEAYVMKTRDKALRKWWAQYMESTGEMETALQFYEASKDFLSLVRVHCYCGNIEKAASICNETGDRAACYHLARQYENAGDIQQAIHFFTRAQAYGNAIRLCRDHGNEDQIMNLALLSRPEDMIEAARYYENRPGGQDKAVMLYHKAGYFSKALDLAFESKQFAALQVISEDLDERTDPQLLQRCADFFIENNQFDRAVDLLGAAKKYWDCLKICMEQHVPMTEELVEKLTPGKNVDLDEKNKIMEGIAEVCMQQRQYHLATKKYTQAGNKVKAMKALLKSGDTEKIIFFAGVSRQKEIYVMAANYLQSVDWRKDPEIMKNIIGFYTKGRALDSLASFYDACAQVEIDEYENYEKALGALSEAHKCLGKATMRNQSLQEQKMEELMGRINSIKQFVQIRKSYESQPEDAIRQCQALLQEQNIDSGIRPGHVYGMMIIHHARKEKWRVAYNCIEDMRSRIPKVNVQQYVDIRALEAIYKALNMPLKDLAPQRQLNGFGTSSTGEEEEDGEVVEEEVADDIYED